MTPIVKQVRRFAELNTDAILQPDCLIFTTSDVDGLIGYKIHSKTAVALGDPLCAPHDKQRLAKAFKSYCENHNLHVVYAIVSKYFAQLAMHQFCKVQIQYGNHLILDPSIDLLKKTGRKAILLRGKFRQAAREGVGVNEYLGNDPELEKIVEKIGHEWLNNRKGPQVHLARLNLLGHREGKRWFIARQKGKIVGFLLLNEIQSRQGYLLNNVITAKDAAHGCSEMLIVSALQQLQKEGCQHISIGPVTTQELNGMVGLNLLSKLLVKGTFKIAKNIFHLDRQAVFWDKFQPQIEPSFILFSKVNYQTVKALLQAMHVSFLNRSSK